MELQDIQTIALQQYKKNLEFLKIRDNVLFKRIVSLSTYIDNQEYNERYYLEYINDDKQFDVFDTHSKTYIYNKEPKKFIKEAVSQTNLDKKNTFDLLLDPVYNHFQSIQPHKNDNLENKSIFKMIHDIKEYTAVFKETTNNIKKEFKYIEKFIFAGTLLGTHILPIHSKIKANVYFIYEKNLELFRLSLFTTDYLTISESASLIFAIMEEDGLFTEKYQSFFRSNFRANYMVKYYCTNYNIGNFFDMLIATSSVNSPMMYKYTKILDGLLTLNMENIPNNYILSTKENYSLLFDKPIILIGAGPSLLKNISWLKSNQNKYLIVAVGASITTLIKYEIKPNIIVSVDPDEEIKYQFPTSIIHQIDDCILLTATATHKDVIQRFNPNNIIFYELMARYKKNSAELSGFSVGEVALNLIIILGANNIHMIGTDLALDQETGETHSSDHLLNENYNLENTKNKENHLQNQKDFNMHTSTITTKGNIRDLVVTNLRFHKSIIAYEHILKGLFKTRKDLKVYNLSDGAYIPYTIPLDINTFIPPKIEHKMESSAILEYLKNKCEIGFSNSDKLFLQKSLFLVNNLMKELENISTLKCKTYYQFIEQRAIIFKIIFKDLNEFQNLYIDKLYINYILITEPYFGYHFNNKEKLNPIILKEIRKIWIKQMIRISNEYKYLILHGLNKL